MEPTPDTGTLPTPVTAVLLLLAAIVLAAIVVRPANAADQTVLGSKLIVKDPGVASKRSAVG